MGLTTFGLSVTVVAAFGWAGLDASRKTLVRELRPMPLLVLLTIGQLPLFLAWAATQPVWIVSTDYVLPGLASVVLNILANLLFLRALQVSPLSLTIPLLSFVPVFATIAANPVLGQLPSVQQLVGIGVVVAGALTLNAGEAPKKGIVGLARALLKEPGSLPMLGTALAWSLTIVVDKIATDHASPAAHGAVLNFGIGGFGLVWLASRRELKRLAPVKKTWKVWLMSIVFGSIGLGGQLVALQHVFVALVESLKRAIGLASSVIVGRLVFKEPITGWKLASVLLMAAGTTAIVFGQDG